MPRSQCVDVAASVRDPPKIVPVTCIGFSAGGVMPLRSIFKQLGPHTGMAFVVIPHLSRTRPTWLPWLLSEWSAMPAEVIATGHPLRRDHIYVIPPGQEIMLADGHFVAMPRSKHTGWSNVITLFLESLVQSGNHAAIAVILSGMDADGAKALAGFHNFGGITIVQDPRSADHKDMPRAAIQTGYVDHILPVEAIASKIEEISKREGWQSDGHLGKGA